MVTESNYAQYVNSFDTKRKYLCHWILNLVSKKTKMNNDFDSWISGFEDRYSEEEVNYMRELWSK